VEENRLKRGLKGVKGGDRHSGGGRICLSVTGVNFFSFHPFPILLLSGSGENRRTGESNAGTATVTQAEAMLQADTHESTKGKVVGEKRK